MDAHKDWIEITRTLAAAMGAVRRGVPDVTKAFSALATAATAPGALDARTKELMAVAISIAVRCDGCVGFHVKAALAQGATRQEILEVVALAIYMGGGPSFIYGAQALEACDQFQAAAAAR
ncbi:MAG: carboxymuconolactone decarboxylase family protein [Rhodospirillaceae bacterium]|nr:carboxymuconolactone decarboxylase family protein [Rhodospirillaceae bacterium]